MVEINYKSLEIVITIAIFRLMHLAGRTLDSRDQVGYLTCKGLKNKRLTADMLISFSQVMTMPCDWDRNVKQEEEELEALINGVWKQTKFRPRQSVTEDKVNEIWAQYTDLPCPEWLLVNFRQEDN